MLSNIIKDVVKIKNVSKIIVRHLAIVLFFTVLYFLSERLFIQENDKIKEPMTLFECFHFSLVSQTTVGYGRLYPTNQYSRIINVIQLLTIYSTFILDI